MQGLKFYEKATVTVFLNCLFLLSIYALRAPQERWPHSKYPERKKQIVVIITGEVNNQGRYHFDQGTTLKEALKSVSLKNEASVNHLNLDQILKPGQKIRIKKNLVKFKKISKRN